MTLHTINLKPQSPNIQACFEQLGKNDAVLFFGNGLSICGDNSFYLEKIKKLKTEKGIDFFALTEKENGQCGQLSNLIKKIDYTEFVQLTVNHTKSISWY